MQKVCVNPFDLEQYAVTQGEWHKVMIFPDAADPFPLQGRKLRPLLEKPRLSSPSRRAAGLQ
jgi:hypothetical protein